MAAVLLLVAAGCSGAVRVDHASRPLTGPSPAAPVEAAAPTAPSTSPPAAAPGHVARPTAQARTALADGRHPARVVAVDAAARLVTVDVVQLFVGEDDAQAATEDGAPGGPPPGDHGVRNVSPVLRTLPVVADAVVRTNAHTPARLRGDMADHQVTLEQLASFPGVDAGIFWVTVEAGRVSRLAEHYLP